VRVFRLPYHLRSLQQNMAYRHHTHSFRCCETSISSYLKPLLRQPEKQKSLGILSNGFIAEWVNFQAA